MKMKNSKRRDFSAVNDLLGKRSRRTRVISKYATEGQAANEGGRAFYHCNYCNKDIWGKTHIKCAQCSHVILCVECFSVGAEVSPHKSDHSYNVVENLSFPLLCPDWNADEELLLLKGIEMYGPGNWKEIADHVGTKSCIQCVDHYTSVYLNSPHFPLPDMSRVAGKNRSELSATVEGEDERKKDSQVASNIEENKAMSSGDEKSCLIDMRGYNPRRREFNVEYDNNAEQPIAYMEFKDTDTKIDHELKLRMVRIYNQRLDERTRRKEFIVERNLLYPDPLLKDLSPEEKEIYHRYNVFMRFHSKEEHEDLIKTAIEEHRMRKRLKKLQEAQRAACHTSAEADRYFERMRRDAEENARKVEENTQVDPRRELITGHASANSSDDWNIKGLPGSDLLSVNERQLCCELKMFPWQYLKMQELMSMEIFTGNISKKSDCYQFFKINLNIVDKVYDMLVRKGIAQPQ